MCGVLEGRASNRQRPATLCADSDVARLFARLTQFTSAMEPGSPKLDQSFYEDDPSNTDDSQYFWKVEEDPDATAKWKAQSFDESLALLDIDQLWQDIVSQTEQKHIEERTVALCEELKHYFWNPFPSEKKDNNGAQHLKHSKDEVDSTSNAPAEGDTSTTATDTVASSTDKPISVFGEPLMFKLRCENKKPKKKLAPKQLDKQSAFVNDIASKLTKLQQDNAAIFSIVVSSFFFEMSCVLFAELVQALEMGSASLSAACRAVFHICAEHANAKEAHIAIRAAISKVDSRHFEGTSYFVFHDVIDFWCRIVKRIPKRRTSFVLDIVKTYERMQHCWESYSAVDQSSEQPGDPSYASWHMPDILLSFFRDLLEAQRSQRASNELLQKAVDEKGDPICDRIITVKYGPAQTDFIQIHEDALQFRNPGAEMGDKAEVRSADEAVVDDWMLERQMILVEVLNLTKNEVSKLPSPPGYEDEASSNRNRKSKQRKQKNDDQRERTLKRFNTLHELLVKLGWTNPVRACQLASVALRLESSNRNDTRLEKGLGPLVRFSRNTKNTVLSIGSVASYMYLALRSKDAGKVLDTTAISLEGSGLDLVEADYAFGLVLPYVMTMIAYSSTPMVLAGVTIVRLLLERMGDRQWGFEEVLRVRCGTAAMGRDVSIYGLLGHVGKCIASLDDPKHRETAYETLQMLLRKIDCPLARYTMVSSLLLDADRAAVAAQFVTELKDTLIYADNRDAENNDNCPWYLCDSEIVRTQFALTVFPRYLLPRKDYLSRVNPIVASSVAAMFLSIRDDNRVKQLEQVKRSRRWADDETAQTEIHRMLEHINTRRDYSHCHVATGRDCVRALAAVSEHDRKTVPSSQLVKKSKADAQALFTAAGRTLNQCISAISSLDIALERSKVSSKSSLLDLLVSEL